MSKPIKWVRKRDVHQLSSDCESMMKAAELVQKANTAKIKADLDKLTDEERLDLFDQYCKSCGSKDAGCWCHGVD